MTAKNKLPVLPEGIPPIPGGYIYLGRGSSFATPDDHYFLGRAWSDFDWCREDSLFVGVAEGIHFAARRDSEIVRLNFPWLFKDEDLSDTHVLESQHPMKFPDEMTLRDWFAGLAMQKLIESDWSDTETTVCKSYAVANSMMEERKKGGDK